MSLQWVYTQTYLDKSFLVWQNNVNHSPCITFGVDSDNDFKGDITRKYNILKLEILSLCYFNLTLFLIKRHKFYKYIYFNLFHYKKKLINLDLFLLDTGLCLKRAIILFCLKSYLNVFLPIIIPSINLHHKSYSSS